ncbi:hypothetical protein [Actinokineospora sp. NBRC 105648]|uniref:hypothetical protein n=1 Tax=Actinokineospora sp. NBRC 105648 TaxID=3032206 RepID=UPI0024A5DA0D|nr:hypothetical protein [Actinokineospora sp. NBRC 105648]GLZ37713.1 hypothetical protein Acsp05_13380 [Actinokineospora sp. NBRC 105648]
MALDDFKAKINSLTLAMLPEALAVARREMSEAVNQLRIEAESSNDIGFMQAVSTAYEAIQSIDAAMRAAGHASEEISAYLNRV